MIIQYLPVKAKELQYAMQVSNLEIIYKMVVNNFEKLNQTLVVEESGGNSDFRLNATPMNRFRGTIFKRPEKDYCEFKFRSLMNRLSALMRIINSDERAKPYLKSDTVGSTQVVIHIALIEAMARLPFYENVEIDNNMFFKEVRKFGK